MKPTKSLVYCYLARKQKMKFDTQAKADNFIRFNAQEIAAISGRAPVRSYYCPLCCAWHVTSKLSADATSLDNRDEQTIQRRRLHYELSVAYRYLSEFDKAFAQSQYDKADLLLNALYNRLQLLSAEFSDDCTVAVLRQQYQECVDRMMKIRYPATVG